MKKKMLYIMAAGGLITGSAMAGTVQQNLGFEPDGTFIMKQANAMDVSTAWNYATNNRVVLGQSFSLTNETTLRSVTLVKGSDWTFSDGTNDLYLWVGEYSTNNTVVSTNLLETFDLSGITLSNNSYFSLNLDADLILPAGDYAFQFWPEQGAQGKLTVYTGEGYADGGFLRAKDPLVIPVNVAAAAVQDLTFALSSEVVGVISNVVPIADGQEVSTLPNADLAITLTGTDPDGVTNLIYTVAEVPANGTLSGSAPDLIYTPDTGFQGSDRFSFTVDDGVYTSTPATVFITVTNIPPAAAPQNVDTLQDTPINITLSGSDPEGSDVTYTLVSNPTNGVLSGTVPDLTYTPNGGFVGNDSFVFTASDGVLESEPATVFITVIPMGTQVAFSSLSADTSSASNLLNVAGSTSGLAVSGVLTNGDYVYSISYTDMDLDGDTLSDSLSFDVRVSAANGTTYTFSETPGGSSATIGAGVETVEDGSPDVYLYNPSGRAWITGASAQGMLPGDTLIYTVENISVTGSAGPLDASFLGFSGIVVAERVSFGHSTILGSGPGLNGYLWDGPSLSITNLSMNPLYVTSAAGGGGMRWGVSTVDFGFSVSRSAPPSSVGDVSYQLLSGGIQIALSWPTEAGFNYGVQVTDNLVVGIWSNAMTGVLGTGGEVIVTNDITEDRLFYRSYLEE
ncbi:Ig-like domain-containing protein [Pontiellaceae bacterium B12219]|nr:Ig-like domain-containing protein [Pontiellaceae bacterium B12219]